MRDESDERQEGGYVHPPPQLNPLLSIVPSLASTLATHLKHLSMS